MFPSEERKGKMSVFVPAHSIEHWGIAVTDVPESSSLLLTATGALLLWPSSNASARNAVCIRM
jgi:hypothetical protein